MFLVPHLDPLLPLVLVKLVLLQNSRKSTWDVWDQPQHLYTDSHITLEYCFIKYSISITVLPQKYSRKYSFIIRLETHWSLFRLLTKDKLYSAVLPTCSITFFVSELLSLFPIRVSSAAIRCLRLKLLMEWIPTPVLREASRLHFILNIPTKTRPRPPRKSQTV